MKTPVFRPFATNRPCSATMLSTVPCPSVPRPPDISFPTLNSRGPRATGIAENLPAQVPGLNPPLAPRHYSLFSSFLELAAGGFQDAAFLATEAAFAFAGDFFQDSIHFGVQIAFV